MLSFGRAKVLLLLESPFKLVYLGLREQHTSLPSLGEGELHRTDAHADPDPDADANSHSRRLGHVAHRLAHRATSHIGPGARRRGAHQSRDCETY